MRLSSGSGQDDGLDVEAVSGVFNTSLDTRRDSMTPTYDAYGLRGTTHHEEEDEQQHDDHERLSSGMDDQIDLAHIHQSLSYVTRYKRRNETLPPILMYEINDLGESQYLTMTLRELLNDANQEAYEIDEAYVRKLRELSLSQKLHHNASHASSGKANKGSSSNLVGLDSSSSGASSVAGSATAAATSGRPAPSARLTASNSNSNLVGISNTTSTTSHREHAANTLHAHHHTSPNTMPTSSGQHQHQPLDDKSYDSVRELRLRDLRRLDFKFNPNEEKMILIRRHAVLIAMVSLSIFYFLFSYFNCLTDLLWIGSHPSSNYGETIDFDRTRWSRHVAVYFRPTHARVAD